MTPEQLGSLIERLRLARSLGVRDGLLEDVQAALEAYARLLAERASGEGGG